MTKEQFIKTHGQPNTVVSFKNDAEKMEFLKECDKYRITTNGGIKATELKNYECFNLNEGSEITTGALRYYDTMAYNIIQYNPPPKSRIKDGWMGVHRQGKKVWFIPSIGIYIYDDKDWYTINKQYSDDMVMYGYDSENYDIMELYDNLGNLQWKREEKSAKDIEIERIQAEMNKLADDLSKLKGE